jgi:hypothetical protein
MYRLSLSNKLVSGVRASLRSHCGGKVFTPSRLLQTYVNSRAPLVTGQQSSQLVFTRHFSEKNEKEKDTGEEGEKDPKESFSEMLKKVQSGGGGGEHKEGAESESEGGGGGASENNSGSKSSPTE